MRGGKSKAIKTVIIDAWIDVPGYQI